MPWDNSKISVGMYWLVHNIDSALESALMALIKMASSKRDSWELLLRKQISAKKVNRGMDIWTKDNIINYTSNS